MMGEHTVKSFDEDLEAVDKLIRDMGWLAADMVERATKAMVNTDLDAVNRVIKDDLDLDEMQRAVDDSAVTLIAKRQPMAQDLRAVVGAIRMASDLERIGDLAKNISKRVRAVGDVAASRDLAHGLQHMAQLARDQVNGVIDLYIARKADQLEALRDRDEEIDVAYTAVFRELLTYMMEDPRKITSCTHLLFCAKNLERIGDHVTNIAENAYYMITGHQLSAKRPKRDEFARGDNGN